ncbi:amino acid ABC transporter permease [Streptosporangiaceae bacterium NEAU-GS5]|nr:amino acid ABC transporter permease [Streptosporangiaceae bacterium NEAU-GS5]
MTRPEPVPPEAIKTIKAIPVRHPGRWAAVIGVGILAAMLISNLITNTAYNWPEQLKYLFSAPILAGVKNTIWLTIAAMAGGVTLGILLALMRLSANPLLRSVAWLYIWLFRGTPLYTQLLIWGNVGALFPTVGLGIPFGPEIISVPTNAFYSAAAAAALGLIVNEAAYMAEIVRAGIQSVDPGQLDAAGALGMSRGQTLRRIVLPQAMRLIVPPTGNEAIAMLKNTSIVAVVPYAELTFAAQSIYATTYQIIPMLVMACVWYLFLSSIMMVGQYYLERHYAKGQAR